MSILEDEQERTLHTKSVITCIYHVKYLLPYYTNLLVGVLHFFVQMKI